MPHIALIDHRDSVVAQQIHAILIRAYEQEVSLIPEGHALPPARSVADIQSCNEYFLGAFVQDELVGTVSVGPDDEPGQISVESLVVRADHQRQSIGRKLMQEALRLGNNAAFSVVASEANTPALALYQSLGFTEYRRGTLGAESTPMVKLRRSAGTHPK